LYLVLAFVLVSCGANRRITSGTAVAKTTLHLKGQSFYATITTEDGTTLEYAVELPPEFSPEQKYPVLLALPPGPQTKTLVDAGLDIYWRETAWERGWVVISPVAPDGKLFFEGSEALIPELLDHVATEVQPEGGKFHLAGISNGGISVFRIATLFPMRFATLTVLPGFPPTAEDFGRLKKLIGIPVAMYVGEEDTIWVAEMIKVEKELRRLGGEVSLEIMPGQGHVIQTLDSDTLFDFFEAQR
jgi:dipeptidyl aminopeptidase/acylaminoacyl peptidase